MSKITLFIYFAAALTFTLIPIYGQKVSCRDGFTLVNGECYRYSNNKVNYTVAKESCEQWNGKLATFSSLDHMGNVFEDLQLSFSYYWIGAQNEVEEIDSYWSAYHDKTTNSLSSYSKSCKNIENSYVCSDNNNNTSLNKTTSTSSTNNRQSNNNIGNKTAKCLYNDSVPFNGQCYRKSPEQHPWRESNNYCEQRNSTVATIYSEKQLLELLTAIDGYDKPLWIAPISNDTLSVVTSNTRVEIDESICKRVHYTKYYGQINPYFSPGYVLCVELPAEPTTTLEPTTTPEQTTTKKTTTPEQTTPKPTTTPEQTTTKPTTTPEQTTTKPTTKPDQTATSKQTTAPKLTTTPRTTKKLITTSKPKSSCRSKLNSGIRIEGKLRLK